MTTSVREKESFLGYEDILDFYSNDIFNTILSIQKPFVPAYDYLRKKHTAYRYKKLLKLKHIPEDKQEKILKEFIECLPEKPSIDSYSDAYKKLLDVIASNLGGELKTLEDLGKTLEQKEQDKIVRVQFQRNDGLISSLRKNISEIILDSNEPEKVMLIDQALYLSEKLIEEALSEKDMEKALDNTLPLLILLLRIEAVRRAVSDYRILYGDISLISADLRRRNVLKIPEPVFNLMKASG